MKAGELSVVAPPLMVAAGATFPVAVNALSKRKMELSLLFDTYSLPVGTAETGVGVGEIVGVGVAVGVGVGFVSPRVRLGEITQPVESRSTKATAQSHTGIKLCFLNIRTIYAAIITLF
jgi:hypothetical protein